MIWPIKRMWSSHTWANDRLLLVPFTPYLRYDASIDIFPAGTNESQDHHRTKLLPPGPSIYTRCRFPALGTAPCSPRLQPRDVTVGLRTQTTLSLCSSLCDLVDSTCGHIPFLPLQRHCWGRRQKHDPYPARRTAKATSSTAL